MKVDAVDAVDAVDIIKYPISVPIDLYEAL